MEAQTNQDATTGAFWGRYRRALAAEGIRSNEADWCVKRAEIFIKSARGLRLKQHNAEDLRAYLCRQTIDGWLKGQYGQMVDALRILFRQIVKSPWASEFQWDKWKEPHLHFPDQLEQFDEVGEFAQSKRPRRLPVVLNTNEVSRLFENLTGSHWLMAGLLYGSGLRLMECLRLRVKDIDFERREILVRDGKGQKDRVTLLAEKYHHPYFHDKRHPKEKAGLPSSVGNPAFHKGSVAFRPRVSTGLAFSASLEFNLSYNNFCKMSTPRLP